MKLSVRHHKWICVKETSQIHRQIYLQMPTYKHKFKYKLNATGYEAIKWICVNTGRPALPPAWLEATRVVSAITDPPPTVSYGIAAMHCLAMSCTVLHCLALPPTVSYALQGTALQCNVLSCSAVHRFAPLSGVGAPPRIPARNLIIK